MYAQGIINYYWWGGWGGGAGAQPAGAGWGLRGLQASAARCRLTHRQPTAPAHPPSAARPPLRPPWPGPHRSLNSKGDMVDPERFTAVYTAAGRFTQPK